MDLFLPVAVIFGLLLCLVNWRAGILLTLTIGFLQEPLRKMIPNQPVWMQLGVGLFFVVTMIGCAMRFRGIRISFLTRQHPLLRRPLWFFFTLSVVYLLFTLVRYRDARLFGIGTVSYVFPLLAALVGFYYAQRADGVRRYILWHGIITIAFAATIYLDYLGFKSPLFEQVGPGIILHGTMKAYCGLFRSSEIAGWHIGAAVCFFSMFIVMSKRLSVRGVAGVLILALAGAAILTGRRKVIMLILLYLTFLGFTLIYFRARIRHGYAFLLLLAGLGTSLIWGGFFQIKPDRKEYNFYLSRSGSVIADSPERLRSLGLGSIVWSIQDNGFFGRGAGTAGQGAQYYGGGARLTGGGAEGGLGRIAAEFGVPGLLAMLWLFLALGREGWRILRAAAAGRDSSSALVVCLMAFLAANVPVFIVASQAYGDPFIIYTLSIVAGFVGGLVRPLLLPSARDKSAAAPVRLPPARFTPIRVNR